MNSDVRELVCTFFLVGVMLGAIAGFVCGYTMSQERAARPAEKHSHQNQ
jgi:hypothetical protein